MIDKPKGKGEQLLEAVYDRCRRVRQWVRRHTVRNPKLARIAAVLCCVAVLGIIVAGYAMPREVTVSIDDSIETVSRVYETTAHQVDRFLEAHEIDYDPEEDEIDADLEDPVENGMEIHIRKAIHVNIIADGNTVTVTGLPMTVEEALKQAEITCDENDIVEPSMDTVLKKGDQITVKRVEVSEETRMRETDFQVVERADSSIQIGDVQITQKGRKGKIRETWSVTTVDGEVTDRHLVKEETVKKKKDKIIGWGTKISFQRPTDLKYMRKIENVRAVSYHFEGNPAGSYGLPCRYGTVAVDPDVIPLGSKLYIEGYGYAVANDVGSAIQGNTVDLYMERFDQCILWGARWTTVYVLG